MILESALVLVSAVSVASTSAGNTKAVGKALDMGLSENYLGSASVVRQIKAGGMWLNCIVENSAIAASANSGTLLVKLYTHSANTSHASTVVASGTVIMTPEAKTTKTASSTTLTDGTILASYQIPPNGLKRYLAVGIGAVTKKLTAGKVTAWIGKEPLVQ